MKHAFCGRRLHRFKLPIGGIVRRMQSHPGETSARRIGPAVAELLAPAWSLIPHPGYQRCWLPLPTAVQSAIRPEALDRANVPGQVAASATGKKTEDEKAEEDGDAGTQHGNRFTRLRSECQAAPRMRTLSHGDRISRAARRRGRFYVNGAAPHSPPAAVASTYLRGRPLSQFSMIAAAIAIARFLASG